jgi:predicted NAD/FAD-dependent oxidoreductase
MHMTSSNSTSKKSEPPKPAKKEVAIIGGGISGLTCALRLSKRGFKVTLYEKDGMLGGDLSSKHANGMYHDVYTHLFGDWYVNFWRIVETDLKIKRDVAFEPRLSVKLLDPSSSRQHSDKKPRYTELKHPNSLKNALDNLSAEALPAPDMFLVGFALLDLASQPFHREIVLEQQTVNGFLYSRPYATRDCADLHNTILNEIWSISSNDTSASAYKDFIKHVFGSRGLPFAWLLRGSLQEMLIEPWHASLKEDHCNIRSSVEVTAIEVGDDDTIQLTLSDNTKATHANVVLAVPAPDLAKLVMAGSPGRCIVDYLPQLSQLQRLRTANILVVTVVFKEKLPDIPPENVGLAHSLGYLTFIDISQLWTKLKNVKEQPTVLILAASDAYAYPAGGDDQWAHLMIQELADYLPAVKPGGRWGDADSNIDYCKSFAQNNRSHTLFLNDMNSEQVLIDPCDRHLPNVFFAGDFCRNEVKMATVEAAVLSGLHAARAVQMRVEGMSDIPIEPRAVPSPEEFAAVKLALLPLAYGATAWAALNLLRDLATGHIETETKTETAGRMLASITTLALLPLKYVSDWVGSLGTLGIALITPSEEPDSYSSTTRQGLQTAAGAMPAADDHLYNLASERSTGKPRGLASLLTDVLKEASVAANEPATARTYQPRRSAIDKGSGLLRGSGRYGSKFEYVRRHRAKL